MDSIEDRLKQLNGIRETIQRYENQLNEFMQEIGWTEDKLPKLKEETLSEESKFADLTPKESGSDAKEPTKANDLEAVVNLCSRIDDKRTAATSFTDLNKLKRDLKRRRVKYRTTKTAPLTYTEELRELIDLQMDLIKDNKEK